MLRYADDQVIGTGLPEPVGGRFGKVTKTLLALAKGDLGQLAVLDVGGSPVPFDDVAQFIAQRLGAVQEAVVFTVEAPEPSFELASPAGLPYRAPLLQHVLHVVRMKRAGPAGRDLIRREAGVVEGRLVKEVGVSVSAGAPDQGRDCVDDKSKTIFGFLDCIDRLLQRRIGSALLGDIHVRPDYLDHIAVATDDRMPHRMYVLYRAIRKSYSKIDFEVRFLPDGLAHYLENSASVFGDNTILEGLL